MPKALIYWHLLSLDAPTVAALWVWFIAATNHVPLPITSGLAMFIAVWILYGADRLLDREELELRHRFHHQHYRFFITGISAASLGLAFLLLHIPSESIHLYLILGGFVFAYFVTIHASSSRHRMPKELVVGICFAAATFIPTVARRPDLRLRLIFPALLFAVLCSLNCLYIYKWEHPEASLSPHSPHAATRFSLHHLAHLTILNILASTALIFFDRHNLWPIPASIAISTGLLLLLHSRRTHYRLIVLRIAADLALLTPLLFVGFL